MIFEYLDNCPFQLYMGLYRNVNIDPYSHNLGKLGEWILQSLPPHWVVWSYNIQYVYWNLLSRGVDTGGGGGGGGGVTPPELHF